MPLPLGTPGFGSGRLARSGPWSAQGRPKRDGEETSSGDCHDVSRLDPENARNSDIFGHNPDRPCGHEGTGGHFDSRIADDLGRGLHGCGADEFAADACGQLNRSRAGLSRVCCVAAGECNSTGDRMLSLDQFLRFISVPAVLTAFLLASQISDRIAAP